MTFMGFKAGTITLDEPRLIYYSGQVLSGTIQFELGDQLTFTDIKVVYIGQAIVKWSENEVQKYSGTSRVRQIDFSGRDVYFSTEQLLCGGPTTLPAGSHSFKFSYQIPPSAPSSFKGSKGSINYRVVAVMEHQDMKRDELSSDFEVVAPLDLNTVEDIKKPIVLEFEDVSSCNCFCQDSVISVKIVLPVSGYCPGQMMQIKIDSKNYSRATRLLVLGALVVLLVTPDTASVRYLLTVPLLFSTCASIILLTLLRYFRLSGWQHLLIEVSLSTPALLFVLPLAVRLSALLVPIMGRLPNGQPDYVIAAASCLLCVLTALCVSGIELLFSRRRLWYVAGATSLVCVVIMFVPFSPYQEDGVAVQRHTWFHSEIVSYDRNGSVVERTSGVLVTRWDVHNVRSAEEALRNSGLNERDLKADCERHPFCNLPLYRPRLGEYLKDSLFLFMEPPNGFDHSLRMTSRTCVGDVCRMQFIMTGPPHNTLTIVPYPNVTLNGWSFSSPLNHSSFHSNQPLYLVTHSTATFSPSFEPLVFSLTFVVPRELQSQPFVRISHDAHRLQDPEGLTPAFKRLTESVPKYFNVAPSVCFKSNYEF